jgi:taurine dioxygenase
MTVATANTANTASAANKVNTPALERAIRTDLSRHVGTELRGVALLELNETEIAAVTELLALRGVLVFRDQLMTLEQQIALGRRFGKLHVHPAFADPKHPEALRIHADETTRHAAGEGWHTDVSCDLEPPAISMLRMEVVPPVGGDTAFASMSAALDELSPPMLAFLKDREAVHAGDLPFRGLYKSKSTVQYPVNVHPVIRTHPITKKNLLYVNSGFTDRIKGIRQQESKVLLQMLFDHVAYGIDFQCRVHWEAHSLTLWDNRTVQHAACWDYFPATRSGWRVTTVGERPYLDRTVQ